MYTFPMLGTAILLLLIFWLAIGEILNTNHRKAIEAWSHRRENPGHTSMRSEFHGIRIGAACVTCKVIFYGDDVFRRTAKQVMDRAEKRI